jgi:protein-disulfide isomerase
VGDDPGVLWVYSVSPLIGPGATCAARSALGAQRQGRYGPFHDAMMEAQDTLDERRVLEIARSVGLDLGQLREAMRDPAIDRAIERNLQLAAALGITGTPSFVIGDEIIPGAVDRGRLEDLIARMRRSE